MLKLPSDVQPLSLLQPENELAYLFFVAKPASMYIHHYYANRPTTLDCYPKTKCSYRSPVVEYDEVFDCRQFRRKL